MKRFLSVILVLCLAVMVFSQEKPKPAQEAKPPQAKQETPAAKPAEGEPKPYDRSSRRTSKRQTGLFKAHTCKGKAPPGDPAGRTGQGLPSRRPRSRKAPAPRAILASRSSTWSSAGTSGRTRSSCGPSPTPISPIRTTPSRRRWTPWRRPTIMMAFPVEALAAGRAPVIDATKFFTADVNEIPVKKTRRRQAIDPSRSFFDKVRVYPDQHERRSDPDLQSQAAHAAARLPAPVHRLSAPAAQPDGRGHLFVRQAPEKPMMGRLKDYRVAIFHPRPYRLQPARARDHGPRLHRPLAPGKEEPRRRQERAGQAHRLLRRSGHAQEMGPLHQKGHRGLAARLRGGRLPQGHRGQGAPRRPGGPRLERPTTPAIP